MKFRSLVLLLVWVLSLNAQQQSGSFDNVVADFQTGYNGFENPGLQLSYVVNIQNVSSLKTLQKEQQFYTRYKQKISSFIDKDLSKDQQIVREVILYEIDLNIERIALETKWQNGNTSLKKNGLYNERMSKEWYAYFLKKWIDKTVTPDVAFQFGLKEIEKVKQALQNVRLNSGMDSASFEQKWEENPYQIHAKDDVLQQYQKLHSQVLENAKHYFPHTENIPNLTIVEGNNAQMAIAPAYYGNNTFYYNFFGNTYDGRDMGWIYVHEAVPGHHYHDYVLEKNGHQALQNFYYSGFIEGWGAYIEQFGRQLGAYKTPFDVYAWLQWDLIRSVRVALDVGLNYYGWTDEKALNFWQQHIPNKDDIAQREIGRMKRWPAQVITYKYGKHILDELKGNKTSAEALKAFHTLVLEHGNIPLSVLKNHIGNTLKVQQEKEVKY